MRCLIITVVFLMLVQKNVAQQLVYSPELVLGNRSYTYQHKVNYDFNDKLKLTNITYYDTEYDNDKNNIYFLRNSLSYDIRKNIGLSLGIGLKTPGSFATVSGYYHFITPSISFLYSVGTTYQDHLTLEQVVQMEYITLIKNDVYALIKVHAISNINLNNYQFNMKKYERGIQQMRLGIKHNKKQYGLAANFDQFNNGERTLENYGLFYRHEF